jgi:uncharacterized protein YndB with AHSA1/START domain
MAGFVATAEVRIAAPGERVWSALTEPDQVRGWMFGTTLETDWTVDGPITWSGQYEGRDYSDKGVVLEVDRPRRLVVTHFSPLSGQADEPRNYHTVTYELAGDGDDTVLSLSQDNNVSAEEALQSGGNWQQMLDALKAHVERG